MTTLVLLSYGSTAEAQRALFAAYSLFAHGRESPDDFSALIFTDQRAFFEPRLNALPVRYVDLTREWMNEKIGPFGNIHRLKIAIIDEAMRRAAGNVLYVDADTFFVSDVSSVARSITENQCVMHVHEHKLEALGDFSSGGTVAAMHSFVDGGRIRLADGTMLTLSRSLSSWNAGVIGLHHTHSRLLSDVYAVCDQLFEKTKNRVSEQYAFSIVLQRALTIVSSDATVYHYYDPVKKTIVDQFIDGHLTSSWLESSLPDRLARVREWTRMLPGHIASHPLTLEDMSLRCLADKRRIAAVAWALRVVRRRGGVDPAFARRFFGELKRTLQ